MLALISDLLILTSLHRIAKLSVLRPQTISAPVLPTYRVMEGSRPKVYYPLSIRRRAISAGKTYLSAYSNLRWRAAIGFQQLPTLYSHFEVGVMLADRGSQ